MKVKSQGKASTSDHDNLHKEIPFIQSSENISFGDLIWIKLLGSFWWPAQIVDESTISENAKPRDKSKNDVLVRLYGSYKYIYIDSVKCQQEFASMLKETSCSCAEVFQNTLEQVLSHTKSGRLLRKSLKVEGVVNSDKQRKLSREKVTHTNQEVNSSTLLELSNGGTHSAKKSVANKKQKTHATGTASSKGQSREGSTRRVKVMQSLGLSAPTGSPFR